MQFTSSVPSKQSLSLSHLQPARMHSPFSHWNIKGSHFLSAVSEEHVHRQLLKEGYLCVSGPGAVRIGGLGNMVTQGHLGSGAPVNWKCPLFNFFRCATGSRTRTPPVPSCAAVPHITVRSECVQTRGKLLKYSITYIISLFRYILFCY